MSGDPLTALFQSLVFLWTTEGREVDSLTLNGVASPSHSVSFVSCELFLKIMFLSEYLAFEGFLMTLW